MTSAHADVACSQRLSDRINSSDIMLNTYQNDSMPFPAQVQLAIIATWIAYCVASAVYPRLGQVRVQKSFQQLFNCRPSDMAFLDKYRVFAIIWVMMNHLGSEGRIDILLRLPSGDKFKQNVHDHPIFGAFLGNSSLGVEIFLVLSGILSAISWFSRQHKNSFWSHYWSFEKKRYLRLAPSVGVFLFLAGGPLMNYMMPRFNDSMTSTCDNVGYLSHIFLFANWRESPTCLGYLWYLGLDYQLYLFIPLMYFLLLNSSIMFYGTISLLVGASMVARALHCAFYDVCNNSGVDIPFISFPNQTLVEQQAIYHGIYQLYGRPHTKCGPFLLAAAFGAFIVFYKKQTIEIQKYYQLTQQTSQRLFYGSLALATITVYAILPEYWEPNAPTNTYNMLYTATFRTIFAAAIIGMIASKLFLQESQPVSIWWTVLGKLSFNVYLLHMPIVFMFNKLDYLQEADGAIELLVILPFVVVLSFGAALIFHIFVEAPFVDIVHYLEACVTRSQKYSKLE